MFGRQKMLRLVSVTGVVLASGGAAWAATTVAPASAAHKDAVHATDVTDGSSDPSTTESTTTDSSTDTTSTTDTTEATTTTVEDTTTTTVEGTTTTTVEGTTTTTVQDCKPGWGYGDKNHCHSGPPGHHKHDNGKHGQDAKHNHKSE